MPDLRKVYSVAQVIPKIHCANAIVDFGGWLMTLQQVTNRNSRFVARMPARMTLADSFGKAV